jgi:hypothetical protein
MRNFMTELAALTLPHDLAAAESLIDASSLIFFVPTLAFKFLVFPECWIVGRPLTVAQVLTVATSCDELLYRIKAFFSFLR